ncbi:MAG: hypothetical protein A2Y10_08960 [Planctomycetes bacterium GWF2_41_51]|nr:MAG: hypothetical protein A2Y10_08960 [Planctomycetes bacterium GWF2_41_51]HBG26877.1 hypothetical protein [Phycisphaerales bacterium]
MKKLKKLKKLKPVFLQGLMAIIPIAITLYVLFWLVSMTENAFGGMIRAVIPDKFYITGMGVVAGLLIIMGIGLLLRFYVFKKLFVQLETMFDTLPIIKSIYGSIHDLMSFFDSSKKKEFSKVVSIDLMDNGCLLMGFVTREDFENISTLMDGKDNIAVYLPMSYQLGGYTVFVNKSKVKAINMSIEDAMRFIFTAAVSTKKT